MITVLQIDSSTFELQTAKMIVHFLSIQLKHTKSSAIILIFPTAL